jgi:hypothetical protein
MVVPSANAFVEDKYILHISQEFFNDAAGHDDVVRSLYFDVEGDRTDFVVWPHKKRINQPLEKRNIAEPFSGLNGRPPEPDKFYDSVSIGAIF